MRRWRCNYCIIFSAESNWTEIWSKNNNRRAILSRFNVFAFWSFGPRIEIPSLLGWGMSGKSLFFVCLPHNVYIRILLVYKVILFRVILNKDGGLILLHMLWIWIPIYQFDTKYSCTYLLYCISLHLFQSSW